MVVEATPFNLKMFKSASNKYSKPSMNLVICNDLVEMFPRELAVLVYQTLHHLLSSIAVVKISITTDLQIMQIR